MMNHYYCPWSIFVGEGIDVTVASLTPGGKGIPFSDTLTTEKEMGQRRKKEFSDAIMSFGGTPIVFDFPDTQLSELWHENQKKLIEPVLEIVRKKHFGAIISFHPFEITPEFDHPDHAIAGLVSQHIGAFSNVSYSYPHLPVYREERPNLFYWTSANHLANRVLQLTDTDRAARNEYLKKYYPSQFSSDGKWHTIFDRITWEDSLHQHVERYFQVR